MDLSEAEGYRFGHRAGVNSFSLECYTYKYLHLTIRLFATAS